MLPPSRGSPPRSSSMRFGADCYAYGLLAAGFIDLVIEASLKPYDFCAMLPIVEGAGGVATDWQGELSTSPPTAASSLPAIAARMRRRSRCSAAEKHRAEARDAQSIRDNRRRCSSVAFAVAAQAAATPRDVAVRRPEIRARLQAFRLRQPERAEGRHDALLGDRHLRHAQPLCHQGRAGGRDRRTFDTLDGPLRRTSPAANTGSSPKASNWRPTSSRCSTRCARRRGFTTDRR